MARRHRRRQPGGNWFVFEEHFIAVLWVVVLELWREGLSALLVAG